MDESEINTDGNTSFGGKTPQKLPQITRFNVFQQDSNSRNDGNTSTPRNEPKMSDTLRMTMHESLKFRNTNDPLDQILHQDPKSPEEHHQLETLQTFKKLIMNHPRHVEEEDREDYAPLLSPHIAHIQKGKPKDNYHEFQRASIDKNEQK